VIKLLGTIPNLRQLTVSFCKKIRDITAIRCFVRSSYPQRTISIICEKADVQSNQISANQIPADQILDVIRQLSGSTITEYM
jgi:hypothetical protein